MNCGNSVTSLAVITYFFEEDATPIVSRLLKRHGTDQQGKNKTLLDLVLLGGTEIEIAAVVF